MKKILTTILAGTLVAGAAFAADAKISLNFRSRLNAFSLMNRENDGTKTNTRDWMGWNNYQDSANDTLDIRLNSDMFGARFTVAANINGSSGSSVFNKTKEFSGWMNFNVGPGTLRLDAGNWADGYADGNYRVKKDADAQSSEGTDFEKFKLGSILGGGKGIAFVDDLTSGNGGRALGGFASYALDVTETVNLNLTVGGVQNEFDRYEEKDGQDSTITTWGSAFASRVQVKVKDVLNAEFIYKLSHAANNPLYHTFGLYVMPQVLDALTLNIGGAAEVYSGNYKEDADGNKDDYFDWGVDLRARYQVMDPLSITFYTNVSGTTLKKGRIISNGILGVNGVGKSVNGTADAPGYNKADGKDGRFADHKFKVAMWNHLTGRYKVNDLLTATLNVGLITPLSTPDTNKNSYSPEWRVTPGIQIFPDPAGKASLWAGVAISGTSWTVKQDGQPDKYSRLGVDIPVIFRVKW